MEEKTRFYYKRTMKHIQRVQDAAMRLIMDPISLKELDLTDEDVRDFIQTVLVHDTSKFDAEIMPAYVDFTWMMEQKRKGAPIDGWTPECQKEFDVAWAKHWDAEGHHPERIKHYKDRGHTNVMTKFEILDCACDLQAMAIEFGNNSARDYFEKVWIKKHSESFTVGQWLEVTAIMLKCIERFEALADV